MTSTYTLQNTLHACDIASVDAVSMQKCCTTINVIQMLDMPCWRLRQIEGASNCFYLPG